MVNSRPTTNRGLGVINLKNAAAAHLRRCTKLEMACAIPAHCAPCSWTTSAFSGHHTGGHEKQLQLDKSRRSGGFTNATAFSRIKHPENCRCTAKHPTPEIINVFSDALRLYQSSHMHIFRNSHVVRRAPDPLREHGVRSARLVPTRNGVVVLLAWLAMVVVARESPLTGSQSISTTMLLVVTASEKVRVMVSPASTSLTSPSVQVDAIGTGLALSVAAVALPSLRYRPMPLCGASEVLADKRTPASHRCRPRRSRSATRRTRCRWPSFRC